MSLSSTGSRVRITHQDFVRFRDFLQDACGILLGDNKEYLVSSRLSGILAELGCTSLEELVRALRGPGGGRLQERVVDAMTTNETLWFRDVHPFNILRETVLPELAARTGAQPLKIWSAACSSGQEPYSISMTLEEFRRARPGALKGGARIMATDISSSMLEQARRGEYDLLALGRGLEKARLERHFLRLPDGRWKVRPEIQARVEFRALNLLSNYSGLGTFDIVFCRNVLIYFSSELKTSILRKIHHQLKPGCYLFLGASESLGPLSDLYEMVHCSPGIIYRAR